MVSFVALLTQHHQKPSLYQSLDCGLSLMPLVVNTAAPCARTGSEAARDSNGISNITNRPRRRERLEGIMIQSTPIRLERTGGNHGPRIHAVRVVLDCTPRGARAPDPNCKSRLENGFAQYNSFTTVAAVRCNEVASGRIGNRVVQCD